MGPLSVISQYLLISSLNLTMSSGCFDVTAILLVTTTMIVCSSEDHQKNTEWSTAEQANSRSFIRTQLISWYQPQPVKAFYEVADFAFFPWFEDSSQHLHVDGFIERCIKVCTLDVDMVDLPILGCGICQYNMHSGHFCCRGECLRVIYSFALSMSTSDYAHPIGCDFTIGTTLLLEDCTAWYCCVPLW